MRMRGINMIGNFTFDENVKPERNRAIRRKNNYIKAKKFKKTMITFFGYDWWGDVPVGKFVKNTSLNYPKIFSGERKTKNKGPNHNGTYAPTHNYKHSDLKKIESMKEDWADYCEDVA